MIGVSGMPQGYSASETRLLDRIYRYGRYPLGITAMLALLWYVGYWTLNGVGAYRFLGFDGFVSLRYRNDPGVPFGGGFPTLALTIAAIFGVVLTQLLGALSLPRQDARRWAHLLISRAMLPFWVSLVPGVLLLLLLATPFPGDDWFAFGLAALSIIVLFVMMLFFEKAEPALPHSDESHPRTRLVCPTVSTMLMMIAVLAAVLGALHLWLPVFHDTDHAIGHRGSRLYASRYWPTLLTLLVTGIIGIGIARAIVRPPYLRRITITSAAFLTTSLLLLGLAYFTPRNYWISREALRTFYMAASGVAVLNLIELRLMLACWPAEKRIYGRIYCRVCGYDLRGLREAGRDSCPECGAPFGMTDHRAS